MSKVIRPLHLLILVLSGCNSTKSDFIKSTSIIILDDTNYDMDDYGGFVTWRCKERYREYARTLIEVGFFTQFKPKELGFILFDGKNSGTFAHYVREGIIHRWNWGGEEFKDYTVTVEPNGDGYYFDMRATKPGEAATSKAAFKCE